MKTNMNRLAIGAILAITTVFSSIATPMMSVYADTVTTTTTTTNPFRSKFSADFAGRIDQLVVRILARWKTLSADAYVTYLANLSSGIKSLALKPAYAGDEEVTNIAGYLVYELDAVKWGLSKGAIFMNDISAIIDGTQVSGSNNGSSGGNSSVSSQISNGTSNTASGTNSSSSSSNNSSQVAGSSKLEEQWAFGFYVINTNTDFDGDGEKEGCNESGLSDPENLCVLKIDTMYVAPKNFTFQNVASTVYDENTNTTSNKLTKSFVQLPSIAGLATVDNSDFAASSNACTNELNELQKTYGWGTANIDSAGYYAAWERVRNQGVNCKNYDAQSLKFANYVAGKSILDRNAKSCSTFMTITKYKDGKGGDYSQSTSTIGNKSWMSLYELGGDGLNFKCDNNSSNKKGLCALQNNQTKLQIFSNGIYYGYDRAKFVAAGIGSADWASLAPTLDVTNPLTKQGATFGAMFFTFGDATRYKGTPVYDVFEVWNPTLNKFDYPQNTNKIVDYTLDISGQKLHTADQSNMLTRCVAY